MKNVVLLISIFFSFTSYSQFHEFNIGGGYAYYVGDIHRNHSDLRLVTDNLNFTDMKASYSLGYRYNMASKFSVGLSFYHAQLAGYDQNSQTTASFDEGYYLVGRNLSFNTAINQGLIDFRFEPLRTDEKWSNNKLHFSPYVGLGFGFFSFNPKAQLGSENIELQPLGTQGQGMPGYAPKYSLFEMTIPLNLGLKLTPANRKYSVSLDWNFNYTTTDMIDDMGGFYAWKSDFASAYATSDPTKYNLLMQLADRSAPNNLGRNDIRGNKDLNDFFVTGQVKFSWYIKTVGGSSYYKCCSF